MLCSFFSFRTGRSTYEYNPRVRTSGLLLWVVLTLYTSTTILQLQAMGVQKVVQKSGLVRSYLSHTYFFGLKMKIKTLTSFECKLAYYMLISRISIFAN